MKTSDIKPGMKLVVQTEEDTPFVRGQVVTALRTKVSGLVIIAEDHNPDTRDDGWASFRFRPATEGDLKALAVSEAVTKAIGDDDGTFIRDDGTRMVYDDGVFIPVGDLSFSPGLQEDHRPTRRLVAFTGLKGSGKDTAASVFVERGYEHIKFADSLKEMLRTLLRYRGAPEAEIERMIEGDLKEEPSPYLSGRSARYAMQTLGTEWGRVLMSDTFWIDAAEDRLRGRDRVVVSDVRFGNEADLIRDRGGSLYRIQRGATTPAVADVHPSETEILTMPVDGVLFNTAATPAEFRERVIRPLAA